MMILMIGRDLRIVETPMNTFGPKKSKKSEKIFFDFLAPRGWWAAPLWGAISRDRGRNLKIASMR